MNATDDAWTAHPDADGNLGHGDKIPLQKRWTFWLFRPSPSARDDAESSKNALIWLDDFDTVQEFWSCFNAMASPSTLAMKQCFHLMKYGIRPNLDDEAHKRGGTWSFKVEKSVATEVWQNLCLAIIGEQFSCVLPKHDEVYGLTAKVAPTDPNQLVFQVWNRDEAHKGAVYDKLKAVLGKISVLSNSFYRSNADELRKTKG
eukprot:GGOE01036237.1.p1 GENE.GGOE01036237.1~~GGOE01036237.1.p1  ORF type:complete len:213 (+),score=32.07 GGOE01036237.1:34-639(+)